MTPHDPGAEPDPCRCREVQHLLASAGWPNALRCAHCVDAVLAAKNELARENGRLLAELARLKAAPPEAPSPEADSWLPCPKCGQPASTCVWAPSCWQCSACGVEFSRSVVKGG